MRVRLALLPPALLPNDARADGAAQQLLNVLVVWITSAVAKQKQRPSREQDKHPRPYRVVAFVIPIVILVCYHQSVRMLEIPMDSPERDIESTWTMELIAASDTTVINDFHTLL